MLTHTIVGLWPNGAIACHVCSRPHFVLTDATVLGANGADILDGDIIRACAACIDKTVFVDGSVGTVTDVSTIVVYER